MIKNILLSLFCLFVSGYASAQPNLQDGDIYAAMIAHGYDNIYQKTYNYESDGRLRGDSFDIVYTTLKYTGRYKARYYIVRYGSERLDRLKRRHDVWRQPVDTICGEGDWPCGTGYTLDSAHRWIYYADQFTRKDSTTYKDSIMHTFDSKGQLVRTASYESISSPNHTADMQLTWLDSMQYNDHGERIRQVLEKYDESDGILTYREEIINTFNEEGLLKTSINYSYSLRRRETTIEKSYYRYERLPGKRKKKKWRPYYDE